MQTNSTIEAWTIFVEIKVANQYSILTKQNSKKKKKVFGKPKLTLSFDDLINDKFHPLYRPTYSNVTFPLSKVQTSNISNNCGQWQCGEKGAIMLQIMYYKIIQYWQMKWSLQIMFWTKHFKFFVQVLVLQLLNSCILVSI